MTRTQVSAIAIAFSALFAGQAMAADQGPVTHAQVKAELVEAIQNGSYVPGDSGYSLRQIAPQNYSAQQASAKSRAEVRTELADAIQNGSYVPGETGRSLSQIAPQNFPGQQVASKSRDEVRAELAEAVQNGTLRRIPA